MAAKQKLSIGKRIAELRADKGWTQAQLAEKIPDPKVDAQYVSKWERGIYQPQKHLEALAAALGVSEGDILAGTPSDEDATPDGGDLLGGLDEREQAARLHRVEEKLDLVLDIIAPEQGEGAYPIPPAVAAALADLRELQDADEDRPDSDAETAADA